MEYFWLPWQEVPGDVVILRKGDTIDSLKENPIAGTSSERRTDYLKKKFPDAKLVAIRGTIDERIQQLDDGKVDLLLMAEAALNRLNIQDRITYKIPLSELPPPEGQGKIAITYLKDNPIGKTLKKLYTHPVIFVGAGTGDPELITIKGQKAIKAADCILYDALANPDLLNYSSANCQNIFVGKREGQHSMQQDLITNLILQKVRQGNKVVRLKGGDPSIFGRLTEETSSLQQADLPYQIIPGISSLNGVTLSGGISLTSRNINQSFLTATATTQNASDNKIDEYAALKQPTVFFMGFKQLPTIQKIFLNHQWEPSTPIALISQKFETYTLRGTLENIVDKVKEANFSSPALILIGDFAHLENDISSPTLILNKSRILLTGVKESIASLKSSIENAGGIPISWPLLQLIPQKNIHEHLSKMNDYSLIILTSPSAVRIFFQAIKKHQILIPKDIEFGVTGPSTAEELMLNGVYPNYIPNTDFSSVGLINELKKVSWKNKPVLLPRSDIGGKALEEFFQKQTETFAFTLYENKSKAQPPELPSFGTILFTSPSCIERYLEQYRPSTLANKIIGCIGKVTEKKALEKNLNVSFVSSESTTEGLVKSLINFTTNDKLNSIL